MKIRSIAVLHAEAIHLRQATLHYFTKKTSAPSFRIRSELHRKVQSVYRDRIGRATSKGVSLNTFVHALENSNFPRLRI